MRYDRPIIFIRPLEYMHDCNVNTRTFKFGIMLLQMSKGYADALSGYTLIFCLSDSGPFRPRSILEIF